MAKTSKTPETLYQFSITHDQALAIAKAQMLSDGAPEEYANNVLGGVSGRREIYNQVRRHFDNIK